MTGSDWALIIVGLISLASAALASRSARSAARYTSDATNVNAKTVAETDAYSRARRMDIETIEQQDKQIEELRNDNRDLAERFKQLQREHIALQEDYRSQQEQIQTLRRHVARLTEKEKNDG